MNGRILNEIHIKVKKIVWFSDKRRQVRSYLGTACGLKEKTLTFYKKVFDNVSLHKRFKFFKTSD